MLRAIILCLILVTCSAYKLLAVFPFPGKSHMILGEGYVRLLLEANHDVTYLTPAPLKIGHPKLRQIDVSSTEKGFDFDGLFNFKKLINKEVDLSDTNHKYIVMQYVTESLLMHPNVQKLLLDTDQTFDAVIVEWMYSDLYSGFSTVFNCPFIWSSSLEPHPMILRLIDSLPNPAYFPDHTSSLEPPYTFLERVEQLWNIAKTLYNRWRLKEKEESIYENAFGPAVKKRNRVLPPYNEVKYNGSLILGNSHVSTGVAFSLPQNYKAISGYYIPKKIPQLPDKIKNIMDKAENGVIYFSMGTMVKSKTLPEELKRNLVDMFGNLKQTVIWKFEEDLDGLPNNVHIVSWAPQQSILAHPNCVLFITHGGLLSTTEALHYGVPIIGIPVFADQFLNIKRATTKGFALEVDINYETPGNLKLAIDEILNSPKYRENIKQLSLVYHDRPVSPGAELVHWVEHVVKTKGALHLRSPALHVPFYQKLYLDLFAVILMMPLVLCILLRYMKNKLFGVIKKKGKKTKKNQ
uniref:UDP-glucuronosyltransferase n=2 Tax=Bombyx mori TaxID=7091 RepID=G9LPU0_BOMMO|nr:UDP-glycosyltransferase UGT40A1 [Bombyx mori]